MELFIPSKTVDRLGNRLDSTVNLEKKLLMYYKLERHDVDIIKVASDLILYKNFGPGDYEFSKIETFFKVSTFISIVSIFVETIDILLLNMLEDVNVKNIIYAREDDLGYYFTVLK